jgi:hypothetical protein
MGQSAARLANVVGGGLSGATAAMSLLKFGWTVRIANPPPRERRPIALNGASRFLLEQIWGAELPARLRQHRLKRRVMAWRSDTVDGVEDETVVVDAADLARLMHDQLQAATACGDGERPDWTITASRSQTTGGARLVGGTRGAAMVPVELSPAADPEALVIEAAAIGWLALMPTGPGNAALFGFMPKAMGGLDELLAGARLVPRSIGAPTQAPSLFGAAPEMSWPPYGAAPGLFVGGAAMNLDPLSGDGAASALRTAHHAASLAEACARGTPIEATRDFYAGRLARAMSVHVRGLMALYAEAPFRSAWDGEFAAMQAMHNALPPSAQAPTAPSFTISERGAVAS